MSIFDFEKMTPFGKVQSVDTSTVVVHVMDSVQLSCLQVNHLIAIRSSKTGQFTVSFYKANCEHYNGPINPDHDYKKHREHGIVNERRERRHIPWHTDIIRHSSRQT